MAVCAGALAALVAAGCGSGDDESTAKDEPVEVSAASEPARVFIERTAKLLATASTPKDCTQIYEINGRSATQFECPAAKKLRNSMKKFKVVDVKQYGSGAIVDYKSGTVSEGATITLHVAPDRNWGIGRMGLLGKPSTKTSDSDSRDGYEETTEKYLASIRDRDCDAYYDVTFNGSDKKDVVCKDAFAGTKGLAKRLAADPDAEPQYEGGNEWYGFYSLETSKPKPSKVTISIAKVPGKSSVPYLVLNLTRGPTAAQQKRARQAFKKSQRQGTNPNMEPSTKPSDPAVTTP